MCGKHRSRKFAGRIDFMEEKDKLALLGGKAVFKGNWPSWPATNDETERLVTQLLRSGRWTISGPKVSSPLLERQFADRFAAYHGSRFCVPTANGSSALVIALAALDIGPGDEVIVPALTWVATASAVLRVGATPVFVDVEESNLCISVSNARSSITPKTKAIIPVHLNYSMADLDAVKQLARETGIFVVEDCAQSHGAIWNGKMAGTFGIIGAFSFQQSKVLACGEGGAVITNDETIYSHLQELRADSRSWAVEKKPVGEMELIPTGRVMGANFCLSEIHAAILLGQLPLLDDQVQHRFENACYLDEMLSEIEGLKLICQPDNVDRFSVFHHLVRFEPRILKGCSIRRVCEALTAEIGLPFREVDLPLHKSVLYRPETRSSFAFASFDRKAQNFPIAENASICGVVSHHASFLGTRQEMELIAKAFRKVVEQIDQLSHE